MNESTGPSPDAGRRVFVLQALVARGEISCGMVVSGEYISHLSWDAARQIRSLFSKQLASLTLGDAGAAVIVERAPSGSGIDVIGFTTLVEHSRLCLAFPSTVGPGAQMYTKSRTLQKVAIDDMAPLVAEAIGEAGIDLADIDFMIPHQTSARAIRAGTQEFVRRLGARPKHVVVNLEEFGNTSSTTLFVALHKYLEEQRIHFGDRVMLLALASGIEIGIAIFTVDSQVDRYGQCIEAASALTSHGLRKPTARRLADAAARTCLAHAGREPGDVDMLINAGIYREDNMGEPALAALIQEDIGANLGQPPIGGAWHLLVRPPQWHLWCDHRHPDRVGPA